MNPLDKHNTTKDDTSDHLIAFLVILGAIAFILQQSLSGNATDVLGKHSVSNQVKTSVLPTSSYSPDETYHRITDAERRQAEKEFAEDAAQNSPNEPEQQDITNTSYRTAAKDANLIAPVTATAPLVDVSTANKKTPVQKLSAPPTVEEKTEITITKPEKGKEVFIDTNSPPVKTEHKPVFNKKPATTTIKQEVASNKQSITNIKASTSKENLASKEEPAVTTYEAASPAITPSEEQFTEKGTTSAKKNSKKSTKKKVAKESCAIIVATLNDVANIKRLTKSLQSENYQIYNRRSGKNRSIGVKTSCNPAVYEPILQSIKKKYAADAWLKKR